MSWDLITEEMTTEASKAGGGRPTLVERLLAALGISKRPPRQSSVAFTIALVSLSAKLAKADGVALRIESDVFERLHQVTPGERANIRRLFDLAAQDVSGFASYAERTAILLRHDPDLMHDVLEGLFHIAAADGILHPEEERYLQMAARAFGMPEDAYRTIKALFIHDPDDPYSVLGLSPAVDDATLKARFRQLVREHHPDHLMGRGMPKEYVAVATEKLAAINAAYSRICKDRGL